MAVDYCSFGQNNEHKVEKYEYDEHEDVDEDDYIDMEVSPFTHDFLSPQNHREFEFHMSSNNVIEKESITSPADELFYKGKLLPLHLPPRLQMVEKLLQDPTPLSHIGKMKEIYDTPLGTNSANTTENTPFESCNISPAESCQVSRELNAEEYLRDFANHDVINKSSECDYNTNKKSWTRKLKTKIKSLFGKSGCSYENSALSSAVKANYEQQDKQTRKKSFGQFPRRENEGVDNNKEGKICHRRSFSGVFKPRTLVTTTNLNSSGSSSTCSSSSSLNDVQFLKRSSSANSEMETSLIQGAIAHCKKSQQLFRMRKTMSEIGVRSFEDQIRVNGVWRG